MSKKIKLIDAHCHLANLSRLCSLEPLLEEAAEHGISHFLSSALTRAEIRYYQDHPHPGLLFSAGIHPNYDECDLSLDDITRLCAQGQIWALGEIGLDRNGPEIARQEDSLIQQLELAAAHSLPVVLHIVGHQQRAFEILRRFPLRYLVHGYAGSLEGFRLLAGLDSYFTVSGRILKPDKLALLQEMVAGGRYLAETDITRHYVKKRESNPLLRLLEVVSRASELCGLDETEFIRVQAASYHALMEHLHG